MRAAPNQHTAVRRELIDRENKEMHRINKRTALRPPDKKNENEQNIIYVYIQEQTKFENSEHSPRFKNSAYCLQYDENK